MPHGSELLHLRASGVSLVLDLSASQLPRILHWGTDLGDVDDGVLRELARTARLPEVSTGTDDPPVLSMVPELSRAWLGTPGLSGHRDGADYSPLFVVTHTVLAARADGTQELTVTAGDAVGGLDLELVVELTATGLIRSRATVTNTLPGHYTLDQLLVALPIPTEATEILDFSGHHLRERSPQRHPLMMGTYARENRTGRTGAGATLLLIAGEHGFGFRRGQVWAMHTAWSGNHRTVAERLPHGGGLLAGGELLLPGEVRLATGESYVGPWIYASFGDGLDEMSARFHDHLRARPAHPRSPRPVLANTWEAMYFDQNLDRVKEFAQAAADAGIERFVLDDGWYRHRRSDHAGLGDWYVDEQIWPEGLHPVVDHVRSLGMDFGLWFEPEMVNPDSDLARAHPEWIMSTGDRLPPSSRHQQVLDLTAPGAYEYLLKRIDSLVGEYGIDYIKWDHNRDLIEAGHGPRRTSGVHEQTLATYRLLDELRSRHPGLEIESCSSGGGRIDLEVIQHTDRVWASDCVDAVERQMIQRWTGLLLPPELIGAHIGSPENHSTGRTLRLAFRAATAFFGHFGVEWDLTRASAEDRAEVAAWVRAHREHRVLLHTGRVVHGDHPDPALWVHGVVARDGEQAIYSLAALTTSPMVPFGRVRLPGLEPNTVYDVLPLPPGDSFMLPGGYGAPAWWETGTRASGRVLEQVGVQSPALLPETAVLLHATRVSSS